MITMIKFIKINKKAFALSINFIVILIFAIAIFALGINFSYHFLKKAETMRVQLDAQTESEIESYLSAGEIVSIPITKKMISDGGAVFGLGVLNVLKTKQYFNVTVECGSYYDISGNPSPGCSGINNASWVKSTLTNWKFSLDQYEDKKIAILITPQNPIRGLYSFIVEVYNESNAEYGSPQIIYVEVP